MNIFKSLSAKIIAAVFGLVAVAFIADLILNRSISRTVYQRIEVLTGQMRGIIEEKDSLIKTLLNDLLEKKKNNQKLSHSLSKRELTLAGHRKESFLEGERFGISTSVASLISSSMMSGDASLAQDLIETLLENEHIAAINLWRTDGTLAFRDNKTIGAVNKFTDSDTFENRDPEKSVNITGSREEALKRSIEKNALNESVDAKIENEEGKLIPVTYSYLPLSNKEECQGCHGESDLPRGVLEVAVPNTELAALKAKSTSLVQQLDVKRNNELENLKISSRADRTEVAEKSKKYTSDLVIANREINKARDSASWIGIGSKLLFFTITIFFLLILLRRLLTKPLTGMNNAMNKLAKNDLDIAIPSLTRNDEIGNMAQAVAIFKKNAIERLRLEKESQEGNLRQQERQRVTENLLGDFRGKAAQCLQAVIFNAEQMKSSASSLDKIASTTSERVLSANQASDQSASSFQSVATATEEMTLSVSEIGEQINSASELISSASIEAQETNRKVAGLTSATMKIEEVVLLIQDIAEQTNLLALNATIEAARAGDAGKGFAVVASEVKQLASQTGKATEDIATHVSTIQGETSNSVEAIQSIAKKMVEINEFATSIGLAVDEQSASTSEISQNIQEAAHGIQLVVENIADVSTSTEETNNSASQVNEASQNVFNVANEMRQIVDEFLDKVAAV
jgi:methyl-accepting chemotaxis protein